MKRLLPLLLVLPLLCGCGTVLDIISPGHGERLNVYGGVRADVELARDEGRTYLLFDLPFSFVVDYQSFL